MKIEVDEGNPMRAIQQLLDAAIIQTLAMRETIKLMEIPIKGWKIRKLAEIHAQALEHDLKELSRSHVDVCARLKELGY